MKKALLILSSVLALASCAKVSTLDSNAGQGKEGPIGFVMGQQNMVKGVTALQTAGHNNFGVFAYKNTDKVNNIMSDYLVGYHNDATAYSTSGTTVGDADGREDGKSQWMYEGLGHAEFTGTFAGQRLNPGTQYASNVANQYLRYWDMAAAYTCFYAYAPYVNSGVPGSEDASVVTYVDGQPVGTSTDKYVMTIPNGTIKHGYDKADEFEFMYAWTKVMKASYGHDVALKFNRLNAKVDIRFWEDIEGYSVRIINLTDAYSISAVPSIKEAGQGNYGYRLGQIYTQNGAKIQFGPETSAVPAVIQYEGQTTSAPLNFLAPDATYTKIGSTRQDATYSPTTYYAIPKGSDAGVLANGAINIASPAGTLNADLALTGLTFHVSYELISTTGEIITVKDATVHVPVTYTNWAANTHYTYIFKITKNSNGTTDNTVAPKPTDPEVPTELGLYPIVFDNCVVEDWKTSDTEHNITDGTALSYHDVQLSQYSVEEGQAADITVTVTDDDKYKDHAIDYTKVTVAGPSTLTVTPGTDKATIAVPATALAGVYTVTYTCPTADIYANHPKTWTEKFVVSHSYAIVTNLGEVGTKGLADSKLTISTSMDGAAWVLAAETADITVEYPLNKVDENVKVEVVDGHPVVVVKKEATPGFYSLVYKVKVEGVDVKVADTNFEVKNYQFSLDHKTVYNKDGGNTVTATALPTTPKVASAEYTVTGGFTVSGNTIAVPNNTAEGEYTVTLTVNKDTASEVQYEAKFTVQNEYTVSLSKPTLNVTVGAPNAEEYGTDFIKITSTKNGVADELSDATAAKYTVPALATDKYKIVFVDAVAEVLYTSTDQEVIDGDKNEGDVKVAAVPAYIKLQVKKTVAAGSYTVLYTGQTTPDEKTASAAFVIQK